MKKTYSVTVKTTSTGPVTQIGVLAEDSATTPSVPAIVVATQAALANAGAGAEVISINLTGMIGLDTTVGH